MAGQRRTRPHPGPEAPVVAVVAVVAVVPGHHLAPSL